MSSIYTYSFLSPSGTLGADINLVNSQLKTTGAPTVNMKEATVSQFLDNALEIRRRETLTPTQSVSAGQVYSFNIVQTVKTLNRVVNKTYSYTSVGVDTTATISSRLIALVNADSEIGVTASGSTTIVLTADSGNSEFSLTIISVGAGLTSATTYVDSAGTVTAPATSYTTATASNVITFTRGTGTQLNFVAGMYVNVTLAVGDSITLRDGTVITSTSGAQKFRIGGTISNGVGAGDTFQISPVTDANVSSASVTGAPTVAMVATFPRGTGAELATRGVVGATSSTVYAEMKLNWLETPINGGAPISKSHSVFVDTTTSANYGPFRYKAINAMNAVTASETVFNTTATNESSAII